MNKSINKFALFIMMGTFLGRILGYCRELIIASVYGVSQQADDVILILVTPDLLNNIISTSIIGVIAIPLYNNSSNQFRIEKVLSKKLLTIAILTSIVFYTVLLVNYDFYISILLIVSMLTIFPNMKFGLELAKAQYKNNFVITSFANPIYNIGAIFAVFVSKLELFLTPISIVIIACIRYMIAKYYNIKKKFVFSNTNEDVETPKYKSIIIAIMSGGLFYLGPTIDKLFTYKMIAGELSYYNYAEKIYLLPLSLVITPLIQAYFPSLSELKAKGEKILFRKKLLFLAKINILLGGSVLIGFLFLGEWITKLIFYFTSINEEQISNISEVLTYLMYGLIPNLFMTLLFNIYFIYSKYERIFKLTIVFLTLKLITCFIAFNLYPSAKGLAVYNLIWITTCVIIFIIDYMRKLRYE